MEITVKSEAVKEELFRKTGEISRKQWAVYHAEGMEFPFLVGIGDDPPYKPGKYDIAPHSFAVNEYHKLTMKGYVKLVPVVNPK
jgi:hypothetical protein